MNVPEWGCPCQRSKKNTAVSPPLSGVRIGQEPIRPIKELALVSQQLALLRQYLALLSQQLALVQQELALVVDYLALAGR